MCLATRGDNTAVRVLFVLVVLATLYGCGQPCSGGELGEKEDVEKATGEKKSKRTEPKTTPMPEAPAAT